MIERALFLNEKIRKWPFRVIFSSHRWLVCNEMWDFRANLVKFGEKRKLKLDTVVSFRVLKGHPSERLCKVYQYRWLTSPRLSSHWKQMTSRTAKSRNHVHLPLPVCPQENRNMTSRAELAWRNLLFCISSTFECRCFTDIFKLFFFSHAFTAMNRKRKGH